MKGLVNAGKVRLRLRLDHDADQLLDYPFLCQDDFLQRTDAHILSQSFEFADAGDYTFMSVQSGGVPAVFGIASVDVSGVNGVALGDAVGKQLMSGIGQHGRGRIENRIPRELTIRYDP